jgi:hypothetical protein
MMRRLWLMVTVAVLVACTREPAHSAVEPASRAPAPPQNGGPTGATVSAPSAPQASVPQPAPGPARAATTPTHPEATTDAGSDPKTPSSTRARDTPPPAQIPNAMPAPDPL